MKPLPPIPCPNPSQVHPICEILPELFRTPTTDTPTRQAAQVDPDILALCQWVQGVEPDSLTYPLSVLPGEIMNNPQAVTRLQLEARWVIDYAKGEDINPPARYSTGALGRELRAFQSYTENL